MKTKSLGFTFCLLLICAASFTLASCGGSDYLGKTLKVEEVDPQNPGGGDGETDPGWTVPDTYVDGLHPIFAGWLGFPISTASMIQVTTDATGLNAANDYDGDGISNDQEITSSKYVADYPRIVTRISPPITMEIRISESSSSENHVEIVEDTDVKNTITNSMEDKQYSQMNQKTTPYVTKESYADSGSHSDAYGYSNSDSWSFSASGSVKMGGLSASSEASFSVSGAKSQSRAENSSVADSFSKSTLAEKTVFEDVDYRDNLDRNGVEFTDSTVQSMAKNYRTSQILKNTQNIGANAGVVRAALFIKNMTVNMPVRVSNVVCTLSFRTPSGEFLPIKSFRLRNDDWSIFEQEIYGGDEFGPFTVEVESLNTAEVRKALANGYVPQIHVVSYNLTRVSDSNYNPGVDNLKIVEETAKGRTATVKVVGKQMRDIYKVCAFDVNDAGQIVPGISLKKALFHVFRDQVGSGEEWETDSNGDTLTIEDSGLKWKAGAADSHNYVFTDNTGGNSWRTFETCVKSYVDEFNQVHRIETIKRIGALKKYNPFDPTDNPYYNPNELLSENEMFKMKYWVILHNGKYYEGDLNDPIWAGDRYEIVCVDLEDFNKHYTTFSYTPLQSLESFYLNTRWNRLTNANEFSRAKLMGKVLKGDVIHLEVDLVESRFLFEPSASGQFTGNPHALPEYGGYGWTGFNYQFQPATEYEQGIPKDFDHSAMGGTNCITLSIGESQLARSYEISFRDAANPAAEWKRVALSREDYDRYSGTYTVTRKSVDLGGNPLGVIAGNVEYLVNVKAKGTCYGVNVSTNSLTNGQVRVAVENAISAPTIFAFNALGVQNGLHLRIADSPHAEYYIVQIEGPLNYGASSTVTTLTGHSGGNIIDIPNPASADEVIDPGVFKIDVFAVNGTCLTDGTPAYNSGQYVTVPFERYAAQKAYMPRKSAEYYNMRALDLEVNFNDGSGWYRLRLSSDDTASKTIDCRYTSYVEYDKQKFHVFFKAPAGADTEYSTIYDVFMGGRDEVDMYMRTVPRMEYRDTFWMKSTEGADIPSGAPYIFTANNVSNFLSYWLGSPLTDASVVEETLTGREFFTLPPGDGGFALVDNGIGDYFFSPLEQRVYRVKASLTDTLNTHQVQQLEQPDYMAVAGDHSITISTMDSQYADGYVVYWKPGTQVGQYEDVYQYPWTSSERVDVNSEGPTNYIITGLTKNQNYIVAVKAENQFGYSPPRFYLDDLGTTGIIEVQPLTPYSDEPPLAPQSVSLALGAGGDSIVVSGIHVSGETRYKVFWKTQAEENWSDSGVFNVGFDPTSYVIANLLPWERYLVKACAVTGSGVEGVQSVPGVVDTRINDGVSASCRFTNKSTTTWGSGSSTGINYFANLELFSFQFPTGTVEYQISYILDYVYELNKPKILTGATEWKSINNLNPLTLLTGAFFQQWYSNTTARFIIFNSLEVTISVRNVYGDTKTFTYYMNSSDIGFPVWP